MDAELTFRHRHVQLHYEKTGSGKSAWLTFHGYGQSRKDFAPVTSLLKEQGVVYSFDIFFHGLSYYHHREAISREEWIDAISHFLADGQIDRFSLAGFSMGCRFMIPLVEAFPERIEKIIFIAPDGVSPNFWYLLATSIFFRGFFKYTVFHPRLFFTMLNLLKKLPFIDRQTVSFAGHQMRSRSHRLLVYRTWMFFRKLSVPLPVVAQRLNGKETVFILGRQDRIIREKGVRRLIRRLESCDVFIVDGRHHHLVKKAAEALLATGAHCIP